MRGAVISTVWVVLLGFCLIALSAVRCSAAPENLLLNGDLNAGSADAPEHWTKTPFAPPESFRWTRLKGEPARLEIQAIEGPFHHAPYWSQQVKLVQPGWYYLRAEVKTDHPGTRAAIKVEGARSIGGATEGNQQWTPLELYFEVAGREAVRFGCGVRGASAGRAFFRKLELNRISGLPPTGARQIALTPVPDLPRSESAALLGVSLAKAPLDESLLRDVLNIRVIVAVLFSLVAMTWLDCRYRVGPTSAHLPTNTLGRLLQHPEVMKSVGVAALLGLALLGTWLVSRVEYLPGHGFYVVQRRAVAGDEPHYLVMINSLLLKHDLQLKAVYDDVEHGGPEAGIVARGTELDRHTIIVNRRTGHRAMDMPWYEAGSEFAPSSDVYEIPTHPAGFPLLLAIVLVPLRPHAREVEPDVGFILMLLAWLAIVATYFVGRQSGMSRGWAMLAGSLLFIASPWLAYSRAYFADSAIGLALILGLWAFIAELPILAALATAASAIMKPPFALMGVGFLVEEVRERRWKDAIKIGVVLGVPALEILAYNFWIYRKALEMGVRWSFEFSRLIDTLLSDTGGLLVFAPWTIFAFIACARAFPSRSVDSRLARTMALPLYAYLLVLSSVGFGAGYCYGPRYWVAFLPWLALGAVEAIRRAGRYQRTVCAVMVLFAIAVAIPGALRYPQLFRRPVLAAWQGFH